MHKFIKIILILLIFHVSIFSVLATESEIIDNLNVTDIYGDNVPVYPTFDSRDDIQYFTIDSDSFTTYGIKAYIFSYLYKLFGYSFPSHKFFTSVNSYYQNPLYNLSAGFLNNSNVIDIDRIVSDYLNTGLITITQQEFLNMWRLCEMAFGNYVVDNNNTYEFYLDGEFGIPSELSLYTWDSTMYKGMQTYSNYDRFSSYYTTKSINYQIVPDYYYLDPRGSGYEITYDLQYGFFPVSVNNFDSNYIYVPINHGNYEAAQYLNMDMTTYSNYDGSSYIVGYDILFYPLKETRYYIDVEKIETDERWYSEIRPSNSLAYRYRIFWNESDDFGTYDQYHDDYKDNFEPFYTLKISNETEFNMKEYMGSLRPKASKWTYPTSNKLYKIQSNIDVSAYPFEEVLENGMYSYYNILSGYGNYWAPMISDSWLNGQAFDKLMLNSLNFTVPNLFDKPELIGADDSTVLSAYDIFDENGNYTFDEGYESEYLSSESFSYMASSSIGGSGDDEPDTPDNPDEPDTPDNPDEPDIFIDSDGDGIPDHEDDDIDGDGIPNLEDKDYLDSDGDGIVDSKDDDIDGDGIPNFEDPFFGTEEMTLSQQFLRGIGSAITNGLGAVGNFIGKGFNTVKDGISDIGSNIADVPGKIWDNVKEGYEWVKDGLSDIGSNIAELPTTIWNNFQSGYNWIKDGLSNITTSIANLPTTLWNLIKDGFNWIQTAINDLASNMWNLFKGGFEWLVDGLTSIYNAISDLPGLLWEAIKEGFTWLVESLGNIVNAILSLPGLIWELIKEGFQWIKDGLASIWQAITNLATWFWDLFKQGFQWIADGLSSIVEAITGLAAAFVQTIIDAFSALFIPDENFLLNKINELKAAFEEKIPFSTLTHYYDVIFNQPVFLDDVVAPTFSITLPEMFGGGVFTIVDFSIFDDYRDEFIAFQDFCMYMMFGLVAYREIRKAISDIGGGTI